MKSLLSLLLLSILSLPSVVLGVDFDELLKRDGLFYKNFTKVPFTGKTSGREQITFKDGKQHGPYVWYHDNEQLSRKGTYKDGEMDGLFVAYHDNGRLSRKGTYKDGKQHGPYVWYHKNGQLRGKGTYKDGKRDGLWLYYDENGLLFANGIFKDGKGMAID